MGWLQVRTVCVSIYSTCSTGGYRRKLGCILWSCMEQMDAPRREYCGASRASLLRVRLDLRGGGLLMTGCGKLDNNGKVVSGTALPCGTKLSFGVNKEPKRTETHLCRECQEKEKQ